MTVAVLPVILVRNRSSSALAFPLSAGAAMLTCTYSPMRVISVLFAEGLTFTRTLFPVIGSSIPCEVRAQGL